MAERGRLDLSADDLGRFVLEAAIDLVGRIAEEPQTPRKPADEATALAARAKAFWRVGSYADGITVAEASLLLEPDQPEIRSETARAYTVLSRLQYDDPRMSKERFDRQVAEALRLSRLACQHAEQYYLAMDFKTSRFLHYSTGDLSWFFSHSHSDDQTKSAIRAHNRYARDMFRRVTETRQRQGRIDTVFLSNVLGHTMGYRSQCGETLAEYLEYRHRLVPLVQDQAPQLLKQIFEHDLPPFLREYPETLAFYQAYVNSDHPYVARAARDALPLSRSAPEERTQVEPALRTATPPAKAELEQRGSSWRATFTVVETPYEDEHGQRHTFKTQGILPVAAGVDVAWGFYGPRVVFVVPQPGKFEKIFEADNQHSFGGGCFDGRYVWLPLGGPNTRLLRIDPTEKTVFKFTRAHGLPTGHPYSAATCPLEPGKIALAATFGQQFAQRSFVAIVEAREPNIANVSVIHESREATPGDGDTSEQIRNTRLAFLPKFMLPLKDENSEVVRRIVIGRSVADPVSGNPSLLVDLPTRTASIVKAGTPSHLTQGDFTIHNGAAYWTASQKFVRLGPQDLDAVATLTSLPEQHAAVLFHHERIFFIGRGCWVTDDPSKPPEEVQANVPGIGHTCTGSS